MKRKDLPMTIVEERLMVFRTEEPAWQPGFTPATISLDLDIVAGEQRWSVVVRGVNAQRRPAPEARQLYEETPASAARRLQQQEIRRLAPMPGADLKGRPTKKAGRLIRGFNE